MQACLLRGSSLHLCLKAGQLSVVTITRRCRCCLDEFNIQNVFYLCNTKCILKSREMYNVLYFLWFYFLIDAAMLKKNIKEAMSFTRGCCVMRRSSRGRGIKNPARWPGVYISISTMNSLLMAPFLTEAFAVTFTAESLLNPEERKRLRDMR